MPNDPLSITLTIHLIKKGLTQEDVIQAEGNVRQHTLHLTPEVTAELFIKTPPRRRPAWAEFFEGFVPESEFGWVSSSSAALLLQVGDRLYAVTFGHGRYLLAPDSSEDQFGLDVALNSITDDGFRSIEKKIFDEIHRRTREQAGRFAAVQEFGMDSEKDLLKAVTGKASEEHLGSVITGGDALNVHVKTTITDLPDLLERYGAKSRQKLYRKKYPRINQISPVRRKELKRKLDAELIEMIRGRRFDQVWLAPPAVIDWERDRGFAYGAAAKYPVILDIDFKTFLETVENPEGIDQSDLERRRVVVMGGNDQPRDHWTVYRCLNCELEHKGDTYVLDDGKWYRVETGFVRQVNQYYSSIPRFEIPLPPYEGGHEKEYNQSVAEQNDNFANLDRDLVQVEASQDSVELCDLFSSTKDLIHVKRYAGSAVLSHLFNQGLVSAEFFKAEESVRRAMNEKLPPAFRVVDVPRIPAPGEYRVVYAIIRQGTSDLTLPFFSKVSARHVIKRLELVGYRVAIARIPFSEAAERLKQVRPSARLQKAFAVKPIKKSSGYVEGSYVG